MPVIQFPDKKPDEQEAYLDAKELGTILRFDARTIRQMAHHRTIPSLPVRNGGRTYYRFQLSEVVEALAARTDGATGTDK